MSPILVHHCFVNIVTLQIKSNDKSGKDTKSIHKKCLVMMKRNGKEGRCTFFYNS